MEAENPLNYRVRKVGRYHLMLFLLPVLSLLYYSWWEADTLNQRADNPQRISPMASRGRILDRSGAELAASHKGGRVYPLGAASGPLVGYQLRGRNRSGMEAILRDQLSPPPPPKSLWGAIERDRRKEQGEDRLIGPDVTLTLDSKLQDALYQAFQPLVGVVAVGELHSGKILAAVSTPSFDPNQIAKDWEKLRGDLRSPLIERVGSGLYPVLQPGGEPLLSVQGRAGHPWLSDSPFPGFPAASSAAEIEEALLVSPLMLMQFTASQARGSKGGWWPQLLSESSPTPAGEGTVWEVDRPALAAEGLNPWILSGPKFGQSPEFEVVTGTVVGGETDCVWVIIVESRTADTLGQLETAIYPILEAL